MTWKFFPYFYVLAFVSPRFLFGMGLYQSEFFHLLNQQYVSHILLLILGYGLPLLPIYLWQPPLIIPLLAHLFWCLMLLLVRLLVQCLDCLLKLLQWLLFAFVHQIVGLAFYAHALLSLLLLMPSLPFVYVCFAIPLKWSVLIQHWPIWFGVVLSYNFERQIQRCGYDRNPSLYLCNF